MKRAGKGALILVSSTAGQYGYPNRAPYCGGKMGSDRPDENSSDGAGDPHGIRANAICPGAVEGPRMEGVLTREAAAKKHDTR